MKPVDIERERKLAELLEASLECPENERESYLAARCDDPDLIAEALTLLTGEGSTAMFFEQPPAVAEQLGAALGEVPDHPQQVGRYRIEEMIGEGGMGVVYAARQTEPVERRLAVKLMRGSFAGSEHQMRFETERKALARLSHPNIAALYDAGATDDGHAYFAMELVQGETITRYCDRHELSIRDRLEIFADVCGAIEHAHRRQLLHRDLKPTNILVAEIEGRHVPKVIDFGIAKLQDTTTTEKTIDRLLGTPSYMSPEAVLGKDLDTRADVYALGVLLYELLCAGRPFTDSKGGAVDVLRRAVEEEPTAPSRWLDETTEFDLERVAEERRSSPRDLRSLLRSELDWIVLKAIAKDREERYGSASALAADIRAYLEGRPTTAHPRTWSYRARKWCGRHQGVVAVSLLTAAALVAGIAFAARHAVLLERERSATEQARRQAEQLVTFLLDDLYEELEPLAQRDFLEHVASETRDYFASLPESLRSSSALRQARAERNFGRVKLQQGKTAAAQEAFDLALALDQQVLRERPGNEALEGLALDYRRMADIQERLGEKEAALVSVGKAISLREQLLADDPDSIERREELAYDHVELGWVLRDFEDLEAAIQAFRTSAEIRRALVEAEPNDDAKRRLGESLKDLGATLQMNDDPKAGEPFAREAAQVQEELVAAHPLRPDYAAEAGAAWVALAATLRDLGDLDGAIEAARKGLGHFQRRAAYDVTNARAREFVAYCHLELAKLLREKGDDADAHLVASLAALEGLPRELGVIVIEAEALLLLGRVKEAGLIAPQLVEASYLTGRPSLEALFREAGFLPGGSPSDDSS